MIVPEINDLETLEEVPYATRTYRVNLETKRISGYVDGDQALMQAAVKILMTDRFACEIYDDNYGNELVYLIGKDYDYINSELDRILNEAFLTDDRFVGVEDVKAEQLDQDSLLLNFTVVTANDSRISMTKEVRYR